MFCYINVYIILRNLGSRNWEHSANCCRYKISFVSIKRDRKYFDIIVSCLSDDDENKGSEYDV